MSGAGLPLVIPSWAACASLVSVLTALHVFMNAVPFAGTPSVDACLSAAPRLAGFSSRNSRPAVGGFRYGTGMSDQSGTGDRQSPGRTPPGGGPTPHDAVFRRIFGVPANAASQLRAVLPPGLAARLDLTRLAPVPGSFVDGSGTSTCVPARAPAACRR
jgi:hypothetical protein